MKASIRHLRIFLATFDTGAISRAARLHNLSQPAVTQSIGGLERRVGLPLFERIPRGLAATTAGNVLARRVRRFFARLDAALVDVAPRLVLTATTSQLTALIAAVEAENLTLAARRLGLAQPTVHRAITGLELEVGKALFERTSRGMLASRPAVALAGAAKLAFSELEQADAEIGELLGREVGRIMIGAMPFSRVSLLPTAIARFRANWPTLAIHTVEGPYTSLLDGLRRGRLDFLIGALRDPVPVDDVEQEPLVEDRHVVVCGPGHEILSFETFAPERLAAYPWVVAPPGTPSRWIFDRIFTGPKAPASLVETSSMMLMRELMAVSHHLGFVSAGLIRREVRTGGLVPVPLELAGTTRIIGLSTRAGWMPTRAQSEFLEEIRHAARRAAVTTDENGRTSWD